VTYERSSADQAGGAYTLSANFTWTVTWAGSDGAGGAMVPGTLADGVSVPVGEVQSVTGG
jgi:hypothetical protein